MDVMRRVERYLVGLAAGAVVLGAAAQEGAGDVVYVPTPQVVVEAMLKMAKVGADDFVIDLGSGDGRMVITAAKKHGARGFGVDLDPVLLKVSNERAQREGVADRAQFYERNLFETDLSQASVITSYLLPEMNLKLRPGILALAPGTRVVAHDYHFGEWYPDEYDTLPVPEKEVGSPGVSYIYLWIVPAHIAGKWQSEIKVNGRALAYEFAFEQRFQKFDATLKTGGRSYNVRAPELRGDRLSFSVLVKSGGNTVRQDFKGRVRGDAIEGTVRIGEGAAAREAPWIAQRTARAEMRISADGNARLALRRP